VTILSNKIYITSISKIDAILSQFLTIDYKFVGYGMNLVCLYFVSEILMLIFRKERANE